MTDLKADRKAEGQECRKAESSLQNPENTLQKPGLDELKKEEFFHPENTLGHKFRMVSVAVDKYFHKKEIVENALPKGQGPICGYLRRNEDHPVFQKDIEKFFHVSGATASHSLHNMEKNGIIERIPMPEDSRLKRIILTEKGRRVQENDEQNILRLEETMRRSLTEEELQQFSSQLDRIITSLRELNGDGSFFTH